MVNLCALMRGAAGTKQSNQMGARAQCARDPTLLAGGQLRAPVGGTRRSAHDEMRAASPLVRLPSARARPLLHSIVGCRCRARARPAALSLRRPAGGGRHRAKPN